MPIPAEHRTLQLKGESSLPRLKRLLRYAQEHFYTIKVDYYSRTSDRFTGGRLLDPYELNGLYVKAFCHVRREVRSFNIKRILKIKVLKTVFSKKTERPGIGTLGTLIKIDAPPRVPEAPAVRVLGRLIKSDVPQPALEARAAKLPDKKIKRKNKRTYTAITASDRETLFYIVVYGACFLAIACYWLYCFFLEVAYWTDWEGVYLVMALMYGSLFSLKRWFLNKYFPQPAVRVRKRARPHGAGPRSARKKSGRGMPLKTIQQWVTALLDRIDRI